MSSNLTKEKIVEKLNSVKNIKLSKEIKLCLYFIIELIFTLVMLLYLHGLKDMFSLNSVYDQYLFNILTMAVILLIWFVGPMLNRLILFLFNGLIATYLISQEIYYRAFNQYYRFNTAISLREEALGVTDSIEEFIEFSDFMPIINLFLMCTVFFILYLLFQRRCFNFKWRLIYKVAILGLIFPISATFEDFTLAIEETKDQKDVFLLNETDYYIYTVMPSVNQFVETFGLLTYAHRDLVSLNDTISVTPEDYQKIDEFLTSLPAQNSNEMTGIFEGKNILFIQAESYMNIMCDPDLTPVIYKMKNEGINIVNFNTPLLDGSTSDTEFMANTSIIPNSDGYAVAYKYPYNTYPTTLPSLFNEEGYDTHAFHNNYGTYYNRQVLFPNFGYDTYWRPYDLGFDNDNTDSDIMNVMQWIVSEYQSNYMGYWITYSGHQPYILDGIGVSEEHVQRIKEKYPELNDDYVAYWAKNMDLDYALGEFIKILQWQERLDDWVFVFFGDHIAKGLDFGASSDFYAQTKLPYDETDYYTGLYIYNSAYGAMEYEKVSTTLDILPTIANMFNFEIEPGTTLGRDIFDPTYEGYHMSEFDAWKTDNFSYDLTDKDIYNLSEGYTEQMAQEVLNYYTLMNEISSMILEIDYFKEEEE